MVGITLIHHHKYPSAGTPGSRQQFLQQHLDTPGYLARLSMIVEQSTSIAECTEGRLLAIDPWRANPLLFAFGHPHTRQMRMQVKLGFVQIPQLVIGVWG